MIFIPNLYRVEVGPLGPAKKPEPAIGGEKPKERWYPVEGKPHLERNDAGVWRTKDFTSEANHPYPRVPLTPKEAEEPMGAVVGGGGGWLAPEPDPWGYVAERIAEVSTITAQKISRVVDLVKLDAARKRAMVWLTPTESLRHSTDVVDMTVHLKTCGPRPHWNFGRVRGS